MADESDPPRKIYGFKPREFERANPVPPPAAHEAGAVNPDPGVVSQDAGRIDVHELIRAGAGPGSQLGANSVANRENEVHAILRDNLRKDIAAGHYDLGPLDDSKRIRRIRNYCLLILLVDVPLGSYAYWIGHTNPLPFVLAISGAAIFTSWLTWETFFLRTHY